MVGLSKSRVMEALQCPKRLHLKVDRPELAQVSKDSEARFAEGRAVGELAQRLLGEGGTLAERERGAEAAVRRTAELMDGDAPAIYEAAFIRDGVLVYIDILRREGAGWRILEVKSATATKVKDPYLQDCAIQTWVFDGSGHARVGIAVAHVDNTFDYPGGQRYEGLLHEADVTDAVLALLPSVPGWVERARAAVDAVDLDAPVGRHCHEPYACPFDGHCWPHRTSYPVRGLGGRKDKLATLANRGFEDIREVPLIELTSPTHQWIHRVTKSGVPDLREEGVRLAQALDYPRYYLDFETIAPAIPIWPGSRPYQALPFQWSCHLEAAPGAIDHAEFMEFSAEPVMRPLAEALLQTLGDAGPIVTYSSYEKRVINDLRALFPDLAPDLEALLPRLFDLQKLARDHYYHPAMLGSWSIKAVLPTVAPDIDYTRLDEIQDGTAASCAYLEALHPETDEARRAHLRDRLLAYCRLDSYAMVRVLHFFASGGDTAGLEVAS